MMKPETTTLKINNVRDFEGLDLSNFEINKNIELVVRLKLDHEKIIKPIKITHIKKDLASKIDIKIALYGNSSLEMPVEIFVEKGATGTSTNFKANIFLMSDHAKAKVTPGLFIHEKEIQSAGHGVVIKNIKESDTRYLRTRGIEFDQAREMIVGI